MKMPTKFRTATGDLTIYALACGHLHTVMPDHWMESTLSKEHNLFVIEKRFTRPGLAPLAPAFFGPPFPGVPDFLTVTITCCHLKIARKIHRMGWLDINNLIIRQNTPVLVDPNIGVDWNTADNDLTNLSNTVFRIVTQSAFDERQLRKVKRRERNAQRRAKQKGE